jgi:hypothetical protein
LKNVKHFGPLVKKQMGKRLAFSCLLFGALFFPVVAEPELGEEDSVSSAVDVPSAASENGNSSRTIRVARIRLSIDDREFVWDESGLIKEESGGVTPSHPGEGPILRPETIVSFLGMAPGDSATPEKLRLECREAELRIEESGLVYACTVVVAQSRKKPSTRTVVVSVRTGFLWRFGGGNAFGVVGKDALGGMRDSFRIYAGWNRNGARYINYDVGGIPLVLGAAFFWYGPGGYNGPSGTTGTPVVDHPLESIATVGWLMRPDLMIAIDSAYLLYGFSGDSGNSLSVQPFVRWRKYLVPGDDPEADLVNDMGSEIRGFFFPGLRAAKGELSGFFHGRLGSGTTFAIKGAGGLSEGQADFDLFMTEDRTVRSGYTEAELTASSFAFASIELRQRVIGFRVPPGFDCAVHLFAFADVAALRADSALAPAGSLADAYGAGVRVLFDNPVFAYFTFSCGLNHEGNGRFLFCGTAGF